MDEKIIDGLLDECQAVSERIVSYLLLGEKILASSVILLSFGISLAVNSDRLYLLIGLPFCLSFLVVYVLFLNTEAVSLGGYKAALEREVARRLGFPVSFWESEIARIRHGAVANVWLRTMIGLVYAASIAVALTQAVATTSRDRLGNGYGSLCVIGASVSILIGCAAIAASFLAEIRAHAKVRAASESAIRDGMA